uniref:KRAB-related domain-containing protein n=1 Tax=Rhinopithecus bieti TaxID=61621 RepID=A0A2K6LZ48_RHIBE
MVIVHTILRFTFKNHPWRQVCDLALHLVTLSPFWKVGRESASSIKALLCGGEKLGKTFDDIAKYFSKKEWEKMKCSERIISVYMKRKYEAMNKLGFKVTLPPFVHNKRAADFQGNDFDNDRNRRNQVERPQMSFGRLQGIFPKIMHNKPAEEGKDSKGVSEASGPQNDGKQLCPPGKANTSEKINKKSSKRKQFGNNHSGFPGYVQVCGLGVWHGSQTSLGPGWAEELAQLQMRC